MCPAPEGEAPSGRPCAELVGVVVAVEAVAGRALTVPQRARVMDEFVQLGQRDAAAWQQVVGTLATTPDRLGGVGLAAEARLRVLAGGRGQLAWDALHGTGEAWPRAQLPETTEVLRAAVAPWAQDDAARLVLSETDIEGWIHYVSLVREVQGGGALRLALSDRVRAYRVVTERWSQLDADGRRALTAFGAVWPDVRLRWLSASYETQQAWIARAPLPPPMTEASLGYFEAVTREADPARHLAALHEVLGPLDRRLP